MKTFLLASGNAHKAEEFKELFLGNLLINPAPRTLDVEESGKTFIENALIKAQAYYETYKVPTLADDSGLVLEAFPELLGVQSARFMSELPSYADKCHKLLEIMEAAPGNNRRAYFICVLCFYVAPEEVYFFEGRVHGIIGTQLKGEKGFGYDPIFVPERKEADGMSLAELPEWKNQFSHRAKATQAALDFFKETIDKTLKKS